MRQRARLVRKDSSNSLCSRSIADVPWFCNFGKFIDNADYLLSAPSSSARAEESVLDHQLRVGDIPVGLDPRIVYESEAKTNSVRTVWENQKRRDRPLRAREGPRIVSEIPRIVSRKEWVSRDHPIRERNNRKQIDGSGDSAPTSLGEILRRMVSFDNQSRVRDTNRIINDTGFQHPLNHSKAERDDSGIAGGSPTSSDEKYSSSVDVGMSEQLMSAIGNSPGKDLKGQRGNSHLSRKKARKARNRREATKLSEASARNLGAMMRRMVSFERHSKSPTRV